MKLNQILEIAHCELCKAQWMDNDDDMAYIVQVHEACEKWFHCMHENEDGFMRDCGCGCGPCSHCGE